MSATGRRLMTSRALIYRPLIEEETLSHYQASDYFPVHINQVLFDRYKVAVKLGFGGSSTVWLCEDLKFVPRTSLCGLRPESNVDYKTLKILTRKTTEHPEVKVLKHLQDQKRSNGSWCGVRKPRGDFEIAVADGRHHCIVYEALGMNLLEHLAVQPDGTLGGAKTRWVLKHLLEAVDYLHSSGVVHTDIQPDNIFSTVPYKQIIRDLVTAERATPSPKKVIDDTRTIYTSRPVEFGFDKMTFPILGDFGTSVFGQNDYDQPIQAMPYRAPEVIMKMRWDSKVDIWSLGVLAWELLFEEHLFGSDCELDSLATMIMYLGPPPSDWLLRSPVRAKYFDDQGNFRASGMPSMSFEDRLDMDGYAELSVFLDFLRSMLAWVPEERKTAAELLEHRWLKR